MASNKNNIKIHQHIKVVPPSSSTQTTTTTVPLTFFDIVWLTFHPNERIYFYTLHDPHSHPSFFFQNIVPNLKSSLSLTLQHFLPLAGKIVWPTDSSKTFIQFNSNEDDGVSFLVAESDSDFYHVIGNSPHEASLSRSFIPHLESSDSFASIISLQITLFPYCGFSIGITTHHAVFDGKSLSMFVKAWAYLCNKTIETLEESPTLLPELEPLFNRHIIKDTNENKSIEFLSKTFPNEKPNQRSLKIFASEPKLEVSLRATFKLTREDLNKIKQKVLSKWKILDTNESKPETLSSFILTCAYSVVSIARAIHGVEKEKEKFSFSFPIDCRARLEPQIPNNYFGNCISGDFFDIKPFDFKNKDGVFVVAKCIYEKIKMIKENGGFEEIFFDVLDRHTCLINEGSEAFGVAGSNRYGVYENDFGYGRPEKVEIVSIDRGLSIGFGDSKDGNGGVEIGLVLNKHVMDLFSTLFLEGLCGN
ncbi:unnamed protein product [Lathyrus sativus]|nr:unnamed protein product [Lathyrus sativus]